MLSKFLRRSPDATQQLPDPPIGVVLRVDVAIAAEVQETPIRRAIRRKRPVPTVRALVVDRGAKRVATVGAA